MKEISLLDHVEGEMRGAAPRTQKKVLLIQGLESYNKVGSCDLQNSGIL